MKLLNYLVGFLLLLVAGATIPLCAVGLILSLGTIINEITYQTGTEAQVRAVYVFDRGAVYGYKRALRELQPRYERLIHEAVERNELRHRIASNRKVAPKKRKPVISIKFEPTIKYLKRDGTVR